MTPGDLLGASAAGDTTPIITAGLAHTAADLAAAFVTVGVAAADTTRTAAPIGTTSLIRTVRLAQALSIEADVLGVGTLPTGTAASVGTTELARAVRGADLDALTVVAALGAARADAA